MTSSETRTESPWDTESYELIAALYDVEADAHTCGHPLSETTSWEADEDNKERSVFYEVEAPPKCMACVVLHRAQDDVEARNGKHTPEYMWRVNRV